MELQFFNAPKKSLCFASVAEPSMQAWHRLKAMQAPWLVVTGIDGKTAGVMPVDSMREAMRQRGQGMVGSLPFRAAAVLPHRAKLSEVLEALADTAIEAVLLVDGAQVHTVVIRQPH
jgi:hypothetical protein